MRKALVLASLFGWMFFMFLLQFFYFAMSWDTMIQLLQKVAELEGSETVARIAAVLSHFLNDPPFIGGVERGLPYAMGASGVLAMYVTIRQDAAFLDCGEEPY